MLDSWGQVVSHYLSGRRQVVICAVTLSLFVCNVIDITDVNSFIQILKANVNISLAKVMTIRKLA